MNYPACPICQCPCKITDQINFSNITCFRCGKFEITSMAISNLSQHFETISKRWMLSSHIFFHPAIRITIEDLDYLKTITKPLISKRARWLLSSLAKAYPNIGQSIEVGYPEANELTDLIADNGNNPYDLDRDGQIGGRLQHLRQFAPMLAASWSETGTELCYLLTDYLGDTLGYLTYDKRMPRLLYISGSGWEFLQESIKSLDSNEVFIAMSFNHSLDKFYEDVIKAGMKQAGYDPVRMDESKHNNRIDDEIMAQIRKSKFIVADLTKQNQGVYFEAGFALGLGLQVIWMCEEREFENVHFDTRQYNTIIWSEANYADAKKRLQDRIEANFGQGKPKKPDHQ